MMCDCKELIPKMYKGERACCEYLTASKIRHKRQVYIPELPGRYFEFQFRIGERRYLLEFDNSHHFEDVTCFGLTFRELRNIDIEKTLAAIKAGYFLIRIDFTCLDDIQSHIDRAIVSSLKPSLKSSKSSNSSSGQLYYLSTPKLYNYILNEICSRRVQV